MRSPSLPPRRSCAGLVLALCLAVQPAHAATDPVEDLRLALPIRLDDIANPTPSLLQYRQEILQKRVDALKTIPQLRRALSLEEWKEDPNRIINDKLRDIDASIRKQVGDRLMQAIRQVIKTGDATAKLAVANLISEMGPTVRAINPEERGGFARTLTPEVIELVKDKDLAVRQEALRALGNLNGNPKVVVPVLVTVISKDSIGPRRLAADGLAQMLRVLLHLQKRARTSSGVETSRGDVLDTARYVIDGAGVGLIDPDSQVRALTLTALQLAAQALADQIPDAFTKKDFPSVGRKISEEEQADILARREIVKNDMLEVATGFVALRERLPAVVNTLQDADSVVRLSALNALEGIANARLRARRRVLSVPTVHTGKVSESDDARQALAKYDPMADFLAKDLPVAARALSDPDIRIRRACADFIELLEDAALPVLDQMVQALRDSDRFVRWASARAIAYLPAAKAAVAVPVLGELLFDPDLNVRQAAATTLESMGELAKGAAPYLARAVSEGDAEPRMNAMYVLQALDPADAKVAIPTLIDALNHADARVRRVAAESLGKIGPAASAAVPALRRALGDEDNEVRVQASDALLAILVGPVK